MSATPEPKKESLLKNPFMLTLIAGAITLLAVVIAPYFVPHPDVTALCTPNPLSIPVYTEQYVDTLLTDIDKLKAAPGTRTDLGQHGMDKLDAQVGGEVICTVKNTGSTKASDIQITMPPSAVTLYAGGEPIAFDPKRPMYKLPSLNPGDGVTIVAQYHFVLVPATLGATPPNLTYAEGTSTVQIEGPVHGFPATAAWIVSSGFWKVGVLPIVFLLLITLVPAWQRYKARKTVTGTQ